MAVTKKGAIWKLSWEETEEIIMSGVVPRILLMGPPGIGKTYAAIKRRSAGQPVFVTTLTDETPAAELRGHFVPGANGFLWMDGPAVAAWRTGGRLVLNEVDQASGDAHTFLHCILDDPELAMLTLPVYEDGTREHIVVRPEEGFTAVATTNASADSLPEALADRFTVKILLTTPHPQALARLPEDLRAIASTMVNLDEKRRVGLRAWMGFADLRESLRETYTDAADCERIAACAVFGARAQDIMNAIRMGA